jgi:hypothetical protein
MDLMIVIAIILRDLSEFVEKYGILKENVLLMLEQTMC